MKLINTLNNDLTEILTNGIFKAIERTNLEINKLPWFKSENINIDYLNMEYYFNISGQKTISPLFNNLITQSSTRLYENLSGLIIFKFYDKWNKIYNAYISSEYNPLNNYDLQENENYTKGLNGTFDKNVNSKSDITRDNERKENIETNSTLENNIDNSLYGLNSINKVPSNEQLNNSTQNIVANADKNFVNETNIESGNNTSTELNHNNQNEDFKKTLERFGNIGVTTTQQMLKSELDLREWNFYDMLFKDIDSVLCLKIYE